MIHIFALIALNLAVPHPVIHGPSLHFDQAQNASSDGRVKNPRKFVEVAQGVQYEGEYSPPIGRQPEQMVSPTRPVRYLSPEQRALPVIVPPAPRYVEEQSPSAAAEKATNVAPPTSNNASFITSTPVAEAKDAEAEMPAIDNKGGSATGSTAVPTYGALPSQ